jgi:uridine kinase
VTTAPEPSPQRRVVVERIVADVLGSRRGTRLRVGIDGVDGAGKTRFGLELATALSDAGAEVVQASVDGFHHRRQYRYRRGRESPLGFFEDSYDYERLIQLLIEPFSPDGDGRYVRAILDTQRDLPIAPVFEQAGPQAILVVDGIFLHRPELRTFWDYSVFLDVDFAVSIARMAKREGTSPDPKDNRRYVEGQEIYLARCDPASYASVVVDYNDLHDPRIVG